MDRDAVALRIGCRDNFESTVEIRRRQRAAVVEQAEIVPAAQASAAHRRAWRKRKVGVLIYAYCTAVSRSPKGSDKKAQGNALGCGFGAKTQALKGRDKN